MAYKINLATFEKMAAAYENELEEEQTLPDVNEVVSDFRWAISRMLEDSPGLISEFTKNIRRATGIEITKSKGSGGTGHASLKGLTNQQVWNSLPASVKREYLDYSDLNEDELESNFEAEDIGTDIFGEKDEFSENF